MMLDSTELAPRWQQCWQDLSIDCQETDLPQATLGKRVFQLLITAYTQTDRYYHNLTHIHQIFTTLDRFSSTLQNPIAVSLAAWFHDFVYDAQASDNEIQSARSAGELLASIGGARELIDRVQSLILATQGHQIDPNDRDKCIFLDADLAILGTDPSRYQIYQRSIRCEYSWVSDEAYQTGRIRVLESFLQRDQIYYTDLLFNELESLARTNMSNEILLLKNTI